MNALRLRYMPEKDFDGRVYGDGELHAHVEVTGFSGSSSAWFNRSDIQEFALRLSTLGDAPVSMRGGHFEGGEIKPVLLGISVRGLGHRGILVHIDLAAEELGEPIDLHRSASLSFFADYANIYRFRADLIRMLDDQSFEAVLTGV